MAMGGRVDEIVATIDDRSARGIAAGISRLITSGQLAPGDRLPTVRDLARRLGTSPTTVSEAWQTLARVGAIESRGRLGTYVLDGERPVAPSRYRRVTEGPGHFRLDLSTGTPDPELLPDLGPPARPGSAARCGRRATSTTPCCRRSTRSSAPTWPFPPEALTVVDGAMDALDRAAALVVRFGDRVLVENPGFPPLLDLLEQLGVEPIGLALDDEGIVPAALEAALALDPDRPLPPAPGPQPGRGQPDAGAGRARWPALLGRYQA